MACRNIDEVKKVLEQDFKDYYNSEETEDDGGNYYWKELNVIEEIYVEIFGQEEFDEFVKRLDTESV